jgi:hypothetical protein
MNTGDKKQFAIDAILAGIRNRPHAGMWQRIPAFNL